MFISAFFKSFDLRTLISSHNNTAQKLLVIRDELKMIILLIHLKGKTVSELTSMYQEIIKSLDDIYSEAPRTTDKAVQRAGYALNVTQDNSFSDEEINYNLPESLQRR